MARAAIRPMAQLNYLERFGLATEPFSLAINPRYAYAAEDQLQAVKTLRNVVLGKSALGVCSGHVGLGKTTLARLLFDELNADTIPVIYLPAVPGSPRQSEAAIYNAIIGEFELRRSRSGSSQAHLQEIAAFARHNDSLGSTTVILLDEAGNVRAPATRALLNLLNLQTDEAQLIQIILFGQNPQMMDAIKANESLHSRLSAHVQLRPFPQEEVGRMVAHRLTVAGCQRETFTPSAIKMLTFASRGVPRDVCQIANKACIIADERGSDIVEESDVESSAGELLKSGQLAS